MLIVDIIIGLFVAAETVLGWRRGFIIVSVNLIGFGLAALAASVFYRPLTGATAKVLHLIPSFAGIVAYALVFTIVELVYFLGARWLLRRLSAKLIPVRLNQWSGSLLNTLKAVLMVALGLTLLNSLPFSDRQKERMTKAHIPMIMLAHSSRLKPVVDRLLGGALDGPINFFTVKPESTEKIDLGFRTTSVHDDHAAEKQMLELVNRERTSRGLSALKANAEAAELARAHGRDMFARGYFSHINLQGQDPFARMKAAKVKFVAAGENLALAPSLLQAHTGLMNSPPHRENILSVDFGTIGIGVIDGGRYGLMVVQEFTD